MIKEGEYVLIQAPDFFKGTKLAVFLKPCKDHEDSYYCELTDRSIITRLVCAKATEIERLENVLARRA